MWRYSVFLCDHIVLHLVLFVLRVIGVFYNDMSDVMYNCILLPPLGLWMKFNFCANCGKFTLMLFPNFLIHLYCPYSNKNVFNSNSKASCLH